MIGGDKSRLDHHREYMWSGWPRYVDTCNQLNPLKTSCVKLAGGWFMSIGDPTAAIGVWEAIIKAIWVAQFVIEKSFPQSPAN